MEHYPELEKEFDRYMSKYIEEFKNSHTLSRFIKSKQVSTTSYGEVVDGKLVRTPLKQYQIVHCVLPDKTKNVDFISARSDFYNEVRKYGLEINSDIILTIRLSGDAFDPNKSIVEQYLKSVRRKISLGYSMEDINTLKFSPLMGERLKNELKNPTTRVRYMEEIERILSGD